MTSIKLKHQKLRMQQKSETKMSAQSIFENAFAGPRDPRSEEYKRGVLDILKHRLGETNSGFRAACYQAGTAQADAYWAGCDEGHRLASAHLEQKGNIDDAKQIASGLAAIWQSN